jgi:hypothetical protein
MSGPRSRSELFHASFSGKSDPPVDKQAPSQEACIAAGCCCITPKLDLPATVCCARTITDLDLTNMHVSNASVGELTSLISNAQSLKRLCLRGCALTDTAVVLIATAVHSHPTLTQLDAGANGIHDVGYLALVNALALADSVPAHSNPPPPSPTRSYWFCLCARPRASNSSASTVIVRCR